jgi:hypothetical protein
MNNSKLKGISLRFRIFIFMILMVVISSIFVAIVTLIEYNNQSEYYHNERLERKENQLILITEFKIQFLLMIILLKTSVIVRLMKFLISKT